MSNIQNSAPIQVSTLINDNLPAAQSYNWLGVLEFLHSQYKEQWQKENQWQIEKAQ